MSNQPFGLRIASFLFALFCVAHLLRLIFQLDVQVAGRSIPMWPSWVAIVVTALLSVWMWRLAHRGAGE